MKVLGYEMGRMIILFPAEEIRPFSGIYLPRAVSALRDRYGFVKTPDFSRPLEELERDGYKFAHGQIQIVGQDNLILEVGFFSDGISVTCLDTAHADAAFNDILSWAEGALGIRPFLLEPRRFYRSQLLVQFDQKLSGLFKKFNVVSEIVGAAMARTIPHKLSIDVARIAFGMDAGKIGGLAPVPFTMERKIGVPFESERYFCEASLPTSTHIEALESIEASLLTT